MSAPLYTVGYEKLPQAALIARVAQAGVRLLVDVRKLPLSRRAGYSKRLLAGSLAAAGIDYLHLPALGTPKEGRDANRRADWPLFWQIVERELATPEAQFDIARLSALAKQAPLCLLCLEADPHICHRSAVAARVAALGGGVEVRHLDGTADD